MSDLSKRWHIVLRCMIFGPLGLLLIFFFSCYSNNSLFAVPANQEFVFIHTSVSTATDPVNFYLNLMRQSSPLIADKGERRVRFFAQFLFRLCSAWFLLVFLHLNFFYRYPKLECSIYIENTLKKICVKKGTWNCLTVSQVNTYTSAWLKDLLIATLNSSCD